MIGVMNLADRLKTLQAEHQNGQRQLAALDAERTRIREALLRIDGAIILINEMIAAETEPQAPLVPDLTPSQPQPGGSE